MPKQRKIKKKNKRNPDKNCVIATPQGEQGVFFLFLLFLCSLSMQEFRWQRKKNLRVIFAQCVYIAALHCCIACAPVRPSLRLSVCQFVRLAAW